MDCITLTGNLLAEWTLFVGDNQIEKTQRAHDESFQVGGKGINMTKMLNRLDVKATAAFFANGHLADFCESWLWSKSIKTKRFHLSENPRIGFITKTSKNKETTVLGKDKPVPLSSWQEALSWTKKQSPKALIIAGSIPGWTQEHLQTLKNFIADTSIDIYVDTYGAPLNDIVELPVQWIKINRVELNTLAPELKDFSNHQAIDWLQNHPSGADWIITDGPNPVIISSKEFKGIINPAQIKEASPTGSGDVTMAALVAQRLAKKPVQESIRFAFACGSANANEDTIAEFELPPKSGFFPED